MSTPISNVVPGATGVFSNLFKPSTGTNTMQTSTPTVSSGGINFFKSLGATAANGVPTAVSNPTFTPNATTAVAGQTQTQNQTQAPNNTSTASLQNTGITAGGGYAGSPANNPYYTAPVSPSSTPAPSTNMGYAANNTPATGNQNSLNIPTGSPVNGVGTNLFPGVASSLANTQPSAGTTNAVSYLQGQATGNNPAQGNINTLTGIGQNQTPAVQQAFNAYSNFNAANPLTQSAQAALPMAALISSGRGQILGNQLAGEQQGLANTYNAAVTGEGQQISAANAAGGQQLTGQQQQIGAANNAGGLANTAQSNQITAQQNAGQLTQPQLGQYGQSYYNPLTAGSASGSQGVQPNDPFYATMQTYAQLRATGQESLIPSSISGNPVLNAQVTQMAQQSNPSYNANSAAGAATAQNSQAQTAAGYQSALSQGENLQSQLSDLITTFNLNPANINQVNSGLQAIAQNTSNPQYQILQNYVNDVANTYSQILTPPGGSATDTSRGIASSMLNATMQGQGMQTVMAALDQAAKAKIAGTQTTSYGSSPNGSSSSSASNGWGSLGD